MGSHCERHKQEKPYPCKLRKKIFASNQGLIYHIRTHTKEKAFSYNKCDQSFLQFHTLKSHMLVHLKNNLECKHCSKIYSHQGSYKNHEKLHLKKKYMYRKEQ